MKFEFSVKSDTQEETDYFIDHKVTINFLDGRCPLTQFQLDNYPYQAIELRTSRAGATVQTSINNALQRGREALRE